MFFAKKFDPLIEEIDRIAPKLKEKIIIQTGRSTIKPKNCNHFEFKPDLTPYIKKARIIIAHGGAGTTYEVLKLGKKLISVDNPEVNDSHQPDLLNKLAQEKYLIWCHNPREIYEKIRKARTFPFKRYTIPRCEIVGKIESILGVQDE